MVSIYSPTLMQVPRRVVGQFALTFRMQPKPAWMSYPTTLESGQIGRGPEINWAYDLTT